MSDDSAPSFWRSPTGITLGVFLAVAGYLLWVEHRPHVISALPLLLLLLACMGSHFFMHGRHGKHNSHKHDDHGAGDAR